MKKEAFNMAEEAVRRLEPAYHEEDGFVWLKLDGDRERPRLRESMYYALGGLITEEEKAAERAERICRAVLDTQMDAPGEVWHGAFRHPDEGMPPAMPFDWRSVSLKARWQADVVWERICAQFEKKLETERADSAESAGMPEQKKADSARIAGLLQQALEETVPVAWNTYEPNTREFLGMTLAMMMEHFGERLRPETVKRMETAGVKLMEGAIARADSDFTPLNTNILIMYIFLLDWFGARLGRADWAEKAELEAEKLAESYREFHSAAEFNSPTYCGVDLSMLGFWRRYGHGQKLREIGKELEDGIWRDVAEFYNPEMRNFCGPYSRAYELEMSKHTCIYDLLYIGMGEEAFPWHPFSIESYGDPLLALGQVTIPEDVKERMTGSLQGERVIRKQFRELSERGDPEHRHALCTATAWIRPEIMIGAMAGSENTSYQLHPLVVFWKNGKGIGTMRMLRRLPDGRMCHLHTVMFDAEAGERYAEARVRNLCGQDVEVFLEIEAEDIDAALIGEHEWKLPGMSVAVETSKRIERVEQMGNIARICYRIEDGKEFHFSGTFEEGKRI